MGKLVRKAKRFCERNPEIVEAICVGAICGAAVFGGYKIGQATTVIEFQKELLKIVGDNYNELLTKYNELLNENS